MRDNHFANISVEFRVHLSNVNCFFCFSGDLRFFLIYNLELVDFGEWMAFGDAMLVYGRICTFFAVFFFTHSPRDLQVSPMYEDLQLGLVHDH